MPTSSEDRVRIADAQFPKPFEGGLEFNAPAHGTWNIVHIGFKIPKAHQIYICADNCMRGVVMTAAEMGELNRFSSVILEEDDMVFADACYVGHHLSLDDGADYTYDYGEESNFRIRVEKVMKAKGNNYPKTIKMNGELPIG